MFEQTENLLKRAAISERWPVWSPKHVHKASRASSVKEKNARGNAATSANHNNIGYIVRDFSGVADPSLLASLWGSALA